MEVTQQVLRFALWVGFTCGVLFAPGAQAAFLFAVEQGRPAVDSGPIVVPPNSAISIDVYIDAGTPDPWGFTVNFYTDGSELPKIVHGSEATGAWQADDWYQVNDQCGSSCSAQVILVVSLDVTVGAAGSLTADGWALIDPGVDELVLLTTLVPEPSSSLLQGAAVLVLMGLAARRHAVLLHAEGWQ